MEENSATGEVIAGTGFLQFWRGLPEKSNTTIRFFNRMDYYTVHGEDAIFVAKEIFKTMTNVRVYGSESNKLESLNINKNQFETIIKDLLLVRHYRVEVYSTKGGVKSNDWFLEFKGSPGNLSQFEDLLFGGSESTTGATVMAIKTKGDAKIKIIGVATVEVSDRTMTVCEFQDDDNFTELEGLIVQIEPKEILVPELPEYVNIQKVGKRSGALISERKMSEFSNDGLSQDLNQLLQWESGQAQNSSALAEMKLNVATGALHALIKYLELSGNDSNFNQFSLTTVEPKKFVHVDTSSAKALGLIPVRSGGHEHSLISFLDRCRTPQGRRLLAQWVKQPLRDLKIITERQDILSAFMDDPELRMGLSEEHLKRFPDLQMLARKLQKKNSTMQDCYKIYQAVERIQPLLEVLKGAEYCAAVRDTFINALKELDDDMENFKQMIKQTLDMEQVAKGEFLVNPSFDDDLKELRSELDELEGKMEEELNRSARELNLEVGKTIKLESTSQIGYHFRTTNKKEEKQIRTNHAFTMIDATKAGIRFQSKKLREYSEDFMDTRKKYDECQKNIVDELMGVAATFVPSILAINGVIAKLDVLTSFSLVSANAPTPYVRPTLKPPDDGILKLKQARHPILEVQDSISFIPNDIFMDKNGTTFYVITGPNMGGKSTYIRTVGIVVLLAHIGMFVPCDEAEISLKDSLLARIGAGDCQLIGVSTFMNEMVETSAILRRATKDSLVMIDELGRGTSTYEGCGLAWAIASYLATNIKAFSLFATHFQELTTLPDEIPSVSNFHVTASTEGGGLTLLYKVEPGPSDRSFGLEVAKMAQFKEHVVEEARKKLIELEQRQGMGITGVSLTPNEIQEGENLVLDFLKTVLDKGADGIEAAKQDLTSKNNRYITAILS